MTFSLTWFYQRLYMYVGESLSTYDGVVPTQCKEGVTGLCKKMCLVIFPNATFYYHDDVSIFSKSVLFWALLSLGRRGSSWQRNDPHLLSKCFNIWLDKSFNSQVFFSLELRISSRTSFGVAQLISSSIRFSILSYWSSSGCYSK